MSKIKQTPAAGKPQKPAKPRPDFPLFPHATGRWAKKIRGKFVYFGPWSDPDGALEKWLNEKDALLAARTPRTPVEGVTVRKLCNDFLNAKKDLMEGAELNARTFGDWHRVCGFDRQGVRQRAVG